MSSQQDVIREAERGHYRADVILPDGEALWVAGSNSGETSFRPWLFRLEGDRVTWESTYGRTEGYGRALVSTAAGLMIVGERALPGERAYRGMVLGLDASGKERWEILVGAPGTSGLKSAAPAGEGVVAVGNDQEKTMLIRVDENGGLGWRTDLEGVFHLEGVAGEKDVYVAVGRRGGSIVSKGTPVAIGFSGAGEIGWTLDLGEGVKGILYDVVIRNGEFIVSGRVEGEKNADWAWMAALTGDGKVRWTRTIPEVSSGSAVAVTPNGLVVVGLVLDGFRGAIVRCDREGKVQDCRVGDRGTEYLNGVAVLPDGKVVVAGTAAIPGKKTRALVLRDDGTSTARTLIPPIKK